jgi:hypothetical protein
MSQFSDALGKSRIDKPIEFLTLIVTTIGLAIAIGGAGFVYYQIVAVKQALDSQAYAVITQGLTDLEKIFVDNPGARPYFFESKPLPDDGEEKQKVLAIGEMYLNFIDNYFAQTVHLDPSNYDFSAWEKFFKHSFQRSKVLCQLLEQEKEEYAKEVKDIARPICTTNKI